MICTLCGDEKPDTAFSHNRDTKTGRKHQCKVCDRLMWLLRPAPERRQTQHQRKVIKYGESIVEVMDSHVPDWEVVQEFQLQNNKWE